MTKAATIVGVQEGYRRWSEVYDDSPNPLLSLEERLLRPLIPDLRSKRVVDLGCGTGRWLSRLLEQKAASVTGIDLSREMLGRAREGQRLKGHLICARCDRLPLRTASTDVILCSFTLGYLPELLTFVREAARIAAPGASVFISDFHPEAHARGWRRSFRCGGEEFEVRNFVRTVAEIEAAFNVAGFGRCRVVEATLGESERAIFAATGKEKLFDQAANAGPAIVLWHFRRTSGHTTAATCNQRKERVVLTSARVALDAHTAITAQIEIKNGRVENIGSSGGVASAIDLSGCLVLPGFINAHDHLEFNLFPRLGEGPYRNSQQWAEAIYRPAESPVREHCAVPKRARLWWGGLKNLFSGATTVCHHNPYDADVFSDFPVRVVRRYGWAHSIRLGENIRAAYNRTLADAPFIIHLAEGTDDESEAEIFELDRLGALGPRTVVVHGVGLSACGHRLLRRRGSALVWCPSSNLFTLGRTIPTETLMACERAALGTDSALSAAGDLLDELRIAHDLGVPAERLFEMVTTEAADVLRLSNGEGSIVAGAMGDLIVVRDRGATPAETLCELRCGDIEAVLVGGRPRLISSEMAARWPAPLPIMQEIAVAGVRRRVDAPVAELFQAASEWVGEELWLAGKKVSA